MVEIFIDEKEIRKYIYLIVLFNATFPKVLEQTQVVINIQDSDNNICSMNYEYFLDLYDDYGLNKIAQ